MTMIDVYKRNCERFGKEFTPEIEKIAKEHQKEIEQQAEIKVHRKGKGDLTMELLKAHSTFKALGLK